MTAYDPIYVLRIAGAGVAAGQTLWTSRPLPYAVSGVTVYAGGLAEVPDVLRHDVGVLDAVGSDAGIAVGIVYSAGGADLLDARFAPVRTDDGGVLRVATAHTFAATLVTCSGDPDLSVSDLVWVLGEAMKVTSVLTGGFTCARGQLGTVAQNIPSGEIGPLVLASRPTIVGARCTLSVVPADASSSSEEQVIYRGVVGSVTSAGPMVRLDIGSALAALRDTEYTLPAFTEPPGPPVSVIVEAGGGATGVTLRVPSGSIRFRPQRSGWLGTGAVTHAWLELTGDGGDALALVAVTDQDSFVTTGTLEQLWIDDRLLDAGEAYATILSGERKLKDLRLADVVAASTPAALVLELLTGRARPTVRGGLDTAQVDADSLDLITRVSRVGTLGVGEIYSGADGLVMPYADKPRKMRAVLEEILQPLGVSIAPGRDGRIRAIDWAATTRDATEVPPSALRAPATSWSMSDALALREVTLSTRIDGAEVRHLIRSDVAANLSTGGRVIEVEAGIWGATPTRWDGFKSRWQAVVALWQRSAPELTLQVSRSAALDIGQIVSLPIPSLVSWDGQRYSAASPGPLYAIVTGVSPRLTAPVDEVRLVAYGWGVTRSDGVWGPVAAVTGTVGGAIQVGTEYTGDDDAAPFEVGMRVILTSNEGTRLDTTDPPAIITAIGTQSITAPDLDARPSVGDLIIPASRGAQAVASGVMRGGTYLADDDDDLVNPALGTYTYS